MSREDSACAMPGGGGPPGHHAEHAELGKCPPAGCLLFQVMGRAGDCSLSKVRPAPPKDSSCPASAGISLCGPLDEAQHGHGPKAWADLAQGGPRFEVTQCVNSKLGLLQHSSHGRRAARGMGAQAQGLFPNPSPGTSRWRRRSAPTPPEPSLGSHFQTFPTSGLG